MCAKHICQNPYSPNVKNLNIGIKIICTKMQLWKLLKMKKKILYVNYNCFLFFFCSGPAISQHCAVCFSVDSGICNTLHPSSAPQASPLAVDLPPHTQKQRAPSAGSERLVRQSFLNNGCNDFQLALV